MKENPLGQFDEENDMDLLQEVEDVDFFDLDDED